MWFVEERFKNASKIHAESVNRHLAAEKSKPAPSSQSNHDDEINDALIQKITASYQQHGECFDSAQNWDCMWLLSENESKVLLFKVSIIPNAYK